MQLCDRTDRTERKKKIHSDKSDIRKKMIYSCIRIVYTVKSTSLAEQQTFRTLKMSYGHGHCAVRRSRCRHAYYYDGVDEVARARTRISRECIARDEHKPQHGVTRAHRVFYAKKRKKTKANERHYRVGTCSSFSGVSKSLVHVT